MTSFLRPSLFGCFSGRSLLSDGLDFRSSSSAELQLLFPFLPHGFLFLVNPAHFPCDRPAQPLVMDLGNPPAPSFSLMLYPQFLAASTAWDSEPCPHPLLSRTTVLCLNSMLWMWEGKCPQAESRREHGFTWRVSFPSWTTVACCLLSNA